MSTTDLLSGEVRQVCVKGLEWDESSETFRLRDSIVSYGLLLILISVGDAIQLTLHLTTIVLTPLLLSVALLRELTKRRVHLNH